MANIDRLINHADGLAIVEELRKIKYSLFPESNPLSWSRIGFSDLLTVMQEAYNGTLDPRTDLGWAVGDEKQITLNEITTDGTYIMARGAETVTLVIMDYDHYYLIDGVTKCKFVIGFKNCLNTDSNKAIRYISKDAKIYSSSVANNHYINWNATSGDDTFHEIPSMLTELYNNAFPADLKSIVKSFKFSSPSRKFGSSADGSTPNVESTSNNLALFSGRELGVNRSQSSTIYVAGDEPVIEYYKNSANRIKKNGDYGAPVSYQINGFAGKIAGSAYYPWIEGIRADGGYSSVNDTISGTAAIQIYPNYTINQRISPFFVI